MRKKTSQVIGGGGKDPAALQPLVASDVWWMLV